MTPLHLSAKWGLTDVTKVLLEAGASLCAVDNDVIKPSVKLGQSNNNNRHFVIKSSQTTQLYIKKGFYKQFSHHHIGKSFFVQIFLN
jgi:hypothetical protein